MKTILLVVALANAVSCGNIGVRSSSLLAPAGVTYVDGSYHAGLAAGPISYTSSVAAAPAVAVASQPVVQASAYTASPGIAVASQPVAVAAAPVAYTASATKYAAVPTVQEVPAVADVPVTRIEAQPGVIQKTVDIARPAVKTQRYEVRRPAIQKQFYDIEERVVVRPAGSAVVELDEPLSRTQKGPSVIRPTGDGVAISSSAVGAVSGVSAVSPAPAALPSVEINYARSALTAPSAAQVVPAVSTVSATPAPFTASGVGLARSSFAAQAAPAVASVSPAPVQINVARSFLAVPAAPAVASVSPAPVQINVARSSLAVPAAPAVASVSPAPVQINVARSSFDSASLAQSSLQANIARSSFAAAPVASTFASPAYISQPVAVKTVSVSAPVQTATITGVSSVSAGVSGVSSISAGAPGISFSTPAPQYTQQIVQASPAPQYQQQIVQTTPSPQFSDDSVSIDSADLGLARSALARQSYQSSGFARQGYQSAGPQFVATQAQIPTRETVFRSEIAPRRYTGQSTGAAAARSSIYANSVDFVPQPELRSSAIYSDSSAQSELNHEKQARLLQLLTARGGVTEVGFGRSGPASYPVEAGQVRARVVSATPAPAYAAPAGERVNTRRVVVSSPIETLQEVEVAEPVTKYERVQVDQPTVFKTARQDVVRVPTSVPVYGKALAPIAEAPVAAYAAGWK